MVTVEEGGTVRLHCDDRDKKTLHSVLWYFAGHNEADPRPVFRYLAVAAEERDKKSAWLHHVETKFSIDVSF